MDGVNTLRETQAVDRDSSRGVLLKEDKVLLAQHERDDRLYWVLPGGHVERGERLDEALRREFVEEGGIAVDVGPPMALFEYIPPGGSRHVVSLCFRVENAGSSGGLKQAPQGHLRRLKFFSKPELAQETFLPSSPELTEVIFDADRNSCAYLGNV